MSNEKPYLPLKMSQREDTNSMGMVKTLSRSLPNSSVFIRTLDRMITIDQTIDSLIECIEDLRTRVKKLEEAHHDQ